MKKNPIPDDPDYGLPLEDPYLQGWLASMDDGQQIPCTLDDNPHEPGSDLHRRWALGCQHGIEEDRDNFGEQEATCEVLQIKPSLMGPDRWHHRGSYK